jgi:hypothetical protein
MIEPLMQLHRCADCPIRCQAMKKPHSVFAQMHRWHQTWWPGWKIYQRELLEARTMRALRGSPAAGPQERGPGRPPERPVGAPEIAQRPAAA